MKISGTFKVEMQPQEASFMGKEGVAVTRMSLLKTFEGELSGHSKGEMLSVVTSVPGSAGYVAIEQVTGVLSGKAGSFVLQHSGLMNRGDATLDLNVVPDSGCDELKGLCGTMTIRIEKGLHCYDFEYALM